MKIMSKSQLFMVRAFYYGILQMKALAKSKLSSSCWYKLDNIFLISVSKVKNLLVVKYYYYKFRHVFSRPMNPQLNKK